MLSNRAEREWADAIMREREAIYRYAYSRLGPELAEEILAATLSAAWSSRKAYDGSSTDELRAWLLGIATNMIRRHWDSERRWLQLRAALPRDTESSSDSIDASLERLDAVDLRASLVDLLDQLDPSDRDLLILNVVHDLDYEALSVAVGIPIGTVKSRLSRCKAQLRKRAHALDHAEVHHG